MSNESLEVSCDAKPQSFRWCNRTWYSNKPIVMGILNLTPDSFADGGQYLTIDLALRRVEQMLKEGADVIDVGAESSRPFAKKISAAQEIERLLPTLAKIKSNFDIPLSVDTYKPEVMKESIRIGIDNINDIMALQCEGALATVAESNVSVCLMHMQGCPDTMQHNPDYQDVVLEVETFLQQRINTCLNAGITSDRIVIDPGFGFGKTTEHNLQLLKNLNRFCNRSSPVLVGLSRKASIGEILNLPVAERLYGSLAAHVIAVMQGATIIRTHDIKPTVEALKIATAVSKQETLLW
jgi:dihydropteroate synthase